MTIADTGSLQVRCPRCNRKIGIDAIASSTSARCPQCSRTFTAVRFDAPVAEVPAPEPVDARLDAAQPCAYHARNAAVANCGRCGSFICSLCRVDMDDLTLCVPCFERLSAAGELRTTRTKFRDFNGMAGVAATGGCLISFLAVLFGPLAIYYGIQSLKQRKRFGETEGAAGAWAAIILGGVETVVGIVLIGFLLFSLFRNVA